MQQPEQKELPKSSNRSGPSTTTETPNPDPTIISFADYKIPEHAKIFLEQHSRKYKDNKPLTKAICNFKEQLQTACAKNTNPLAKHQFKVLIGKMTGELKNVLNKTTLPRNEIDEIIDFLQKIDKLMSSPLMQTFLPPPLSREKTPPLTNLIETPPGMTVQ